ncbi:MAG TPA: VWA domain-containing protein [Pyrinomonadaceae bacterium]|nr:VWA domain-containing protein [Pyrinomonadaceae bacterium]
MIRFFAAVLILLAALCISATAQDVALAQKSVVKDALSYGLVVDNSGSFRTLLDKVIAAVSDVVEENQAEDEAFLVTFVDTPKIVLRQDFTYKKSELHDAAQNMFVEGGQTAILDAVKSAADYLEQNAKPDPGRMRALVLVTDGEDRASETKMEDLLKILKAGNIRVFVIAMSDGKVITKIIDRLAKETGGAVVTPKRGTDVSAAAKQIALAMRTK